MKVLVCLILFLFATQTFSEEIHKPSFSALPYVVYNSTIGIEYGIFGKVVNYLKAHESLTMFLDFTQPGGRSLNLALSMPDIDYRHKKILPLALDATFDDGYAVGERYYGLGSNTPSTNYTKFNTRYSRLYLSLTHAFIANISILTGAYISDNLISNIEQGTNPITQDIINNCRQYYTGNLKLTINNADDVNDPHHGETFTFDYALGVGSPTQFSKYTFDARKYETPLNKDHILAARLALTDIKGTVVPLYEYAYLGGRDTLRGYPINRFRGMSSALVNLEYRFPLFWILSGVTFVEAGKVGNEINGLGFDNWATDIGIGGRVVIEEMIVRGDLGFGAEGLNAYFFYNQAF